MASVTDRAFTCGDLSTENVQVRHVGRGTLDTMSHPHATAFRGPTSVAIEGWRVLVQRGLPDWFDSYCSRARLVDTFDVDRPVGDVCFAAVGPAEGSPTVVVAQYFEPESGGFDPGVAIVPETSLFFVGAGTRLLAYDLERATRLWEEAADIGFWHWSVYPEAVLMSAELELVAWDRSGVKLWTRYVEPPWSYRVVDHRVFLDVMDVKSDFPVTGPPA